MREKWKWEEGYPCLLFMMLLGALLWYLTEQEQLECSLIFTIFIIIIAGILYFLFRLEKKKGTLLIMAVLTAGGLLLGISGKLLPLWSHMRSVFDRLDFLVNETQSYTIGEIVFLYAICFGIVFLICEGIAGFFYARVGVALIFAMVIVYQIINGIRSGKGATICMMGYCFLILMEWVQRKNGQGTPQQSRKALVCMTPFFLVFLLLLIVFPEKEAKYQWKFLQQIRDSVVREGKLLSQRIEYLAERVMSGSSIGESGYSQRGFLGLGVRNGDTIEMQLSFQEPVSATIYLTGNQYSDFDRMEWFCKEKLSDEEQKYQAYLPGLDEMELQYAMYRYGIENGGNLLYREKAKVTFQNLYTDTIFHPLFTDALVKENKNMDYRNHTNGIAFSKPQGFGSSYEMNFTIAGQGGSQFESMVKQESTYHYNMEETAAETEFCQVYRNRHNFFKGSMEAGLQKRKALIDKIYGEKPPFSQKLSEYVNQITAGCDSDYDKLKAVERELSSYQYTVTPSEESGENFPEQFLLQTREGYCTYYATAFVLIARSMGLPARYVQGYCVVVDGREAEVRAEDAHAWPEVYLEGVGWTPFEPTPGYGEKRYQSFDGMLLQQGGPMYPLAVIEEEREGEETGEQEMEKVPYQAVHTEYIFLFLVVLLLILTIVYLGKGVIRRIRYQHQDAGGKMYTGLHLLLQLLEYLGVKMADGDTLAEYFDKMQDRAVTEYLQQLLPLFERTRYTKEPPTDHDIVRMQEALSQIYVLIYGSMGRREKLLLRIRFYDFSSAKRLPRIL